MGWTPGPGPQLRGPRSLSLAPPYKLSLMFNQFVFDLSQGTINNITIKSCIDLVSGIFSQRFVYLPKVLMQFVCFFVVSWSVYSSLGEIYTMKYIKSDSLCLTKITIIGDCNFEGPIESKGVFFNVIVLSYTLLSIAVIVPFIQLFIFS